jgi:hypothetical protein
MRKNKLLLPDEHLDLFFSVVYHGIQWWNNGPTSVSRELLATDHHTALEEVRADTLMSSEFRWTIYVTMCLYNTGDEECKTEFRYWVHSKPTLTTPSKSYGKFFKLLHRLGWRS